MSAATESPRTDLGGAIADPREAGVLSLIEVATPGGPAINPIIGVAAILLGSPDRALWRTPALRGAGRYEQVARATDKPIIPYNIP